MVWLGGGGLEGNRDPKEDFHSAAQPRPPKQEAGVMCSSVHFSFLVAEFIRPQKGVQFQFYRRLSYPKRCEVYSFSYYGYNRTRPKTAETQPHCPCQPSSTPTPTALQTGMCSFSLTVFRRDYSRGY